MMSSKKVPIELNIEARIGGDANSGITGKITGVSRHDEPSAARKTNAERGYQTRVQPGSGRPLDLISPDLFNEQTKHDPTFQFVALHETREHLRNWLRTRNGAFVWKAWRCLMHLESMPDDVSQVIRAYFDAVSVELVYAESPEEISKALHLSMDRGGRGKGNSSVPSQQDDYWFWTDYLLYTKKDASGKPAMSNGEAYKLLAKRHHLPSAGAAKQRILRIRRAGQYGDRSRIR